MFGRGTLSDRALDPSGGSCHPAGFRVGHPAQDGPVPERLCLLAALWGILSRLWWDEGGQCIATRTFSAVLMVSPAGPVWHSHVSLFYDELDISEISLVWNKKGHCFPSGLSLRDDRNRGSEFHS